MNLTEWGVLSFEERETLAKDQEKFEMVRQQLTAEYVHAAPKHRQRKYSALQWKIDVERQKHTCPLDACIAIYDMMARYTYGQNGSLNRMRRLWSDVAQLNRRMQEDLTKF